MRRAFAITVTALLLPGCGSRSNLRDPLPDGTGGASSSSSSSGAGGASSSTTGTGGATSSTTSTGGAATTGTGGNNTLCTKEPQTLLSIGGSIRDIAVSPTHLYAVGAQIVRRAPLLGGSEETFKSGLEDPAAIALDDEYVYFNDGSNVRRLTLEGADYITVAEGNYKILDIALDDTHVYWVGGESVMRAPKDGSAMTAELLAIGTYTWGIRLDATHVYWASLGGEVKRVPKAGGTVETLAPVYDSTWDIDVSGQDVFYSVYGMGAGTPVSGIYRTTVLAGNPVLLAQEPIGPRRIVLDGDYIYYAQDTPLSPAIKRIGTGGGTDEVVLPLQSSATALALTDTCIYATDDNIVVAIAR